MNILSELNALLSLMLPIETGVFSGKAPEEYVVITPMADIFELHANNRPGFDTQEARLSLFSKNNYLKRKKTDRPRFIGCGLHYYRAALCWTRGRQRLPPLCH